MNMPVTLAKPLEEQIRGKLENSSGIVTLVDLNVAFAGFTFLQVRNAVKELDKQGVASLCSSCFCIISKRTFHKTGCSQTTQ